MCGMEWCCMDSPDFRPWILELQGLEFQRHSGSNQQNKGFYWKFQALKINLKAWDLAIPYTTNPRPTFSPLRLCSILRSACGQPNWDSSNQLYQVGSNLVVCNQLLLPSFFTWRNWFENSYVMKSCCNPNSSYHWTTNCYIINSETTFDVTNYITFSISNSKQ